MENKALDSAQSTTAAPDEGLKPSPTAGVSRRQILAVGAAAGAALALPKGALGQTGAEHHQHGASAEAAMHSGKAMSLDMVQAMPRLFTQPRVYPPDASGSVDVTLNVAMTPMQILQQNNDGGFVMVDGQVRAFNNQTPGPTLIVDPGGTIRALMVNNLPPNPAPPVTYQGQTYQLDSCNDPNAGAKGLPFCFNTINLHTHGLHVSPLSVCQNNQVCSGHGSGGAQPVLGSDDVGIEIQPGQSQNYSIVLPNFHAPGTHWYHTHKHGSTAVGVLNGLAGAIIVREPAGQEVLPEEHEDLVWMLQEVIEAGSDQLVYTNLDKTSLFFVNGVYQPTLTVSTGEIQRWRFINATARPLGNGALSMTNSAGTAQSMNLIAVDGILFYGKAPQPVTSWNIAPGNRADFLVQFSTTGTYSVSFAGQVVATINVITGSGTMKMPTFIADNRPCYLDPINAVDKSGTIIALQMLKPNQWATSCPGTPAPSPPPSPLLPNYFVVNCQRYDHNRIDQSVTLNTAEEWTIQNGGGAPHPFHIHVNPFLVVETSDGKTVNQIPPNQQIWWDTFALPAAASGATSLPYIKIRQRFSTYYGNFVLHCHFLNHEDMGMMQNVEVKNDGKGVGPNTPVAVCTRGKN